jgi:hypothetical protein
VMEFHSQGQNYMSDLIWPWHVPMLRVLIVFKIFDYYMHDKNLL